MAFKSPPYFGGDLDFWRGRTGERTDEGVLRGPRGPKNVSADVSHLKQSVIIIISLLKRLVQKS